MSPPDRLDAEIDRVVRAEYPRVVGSLVRRFGELDIAEEAVSESLLVAVRIWRRDGPRTRGGDGLPGRDRAG